MQKFWVSQQDNRSPSKGKIMTAEALRQLIERLKKEPTEVDVALGKDGQEEVVNDGKEDSEEEVDTFGPAGLQAYLGAKRAQRQSPGRQRSGPREQV